MATRRYCSNTRHQEIPERHKCNRGQPCDTVVALSQVEAQSDTVVILRYPSVSKVYPGGPTGNIGNRAAME